MSASRSVAMVMCQRCCKQDKQTGASSLKALKVGELKVGEREIIPTFKINYKPENQ